MILRVVLDTSSLISYALTKGVIMSQVINAWAAEEFILLFSPKTRTELFIVLDRPYIRDRAGAIRSWLEENIDKYAHTIPGKLDLRGACRDPRDNKFLACAVEGQAHYLVSSDKDLLDMGSYQGVCILNPGQFLVVLQLHKLSESRIQTRYSRDALRTIQTTLCLDSETSNKLTQAVINYGGTVTRFGQ